MAGTTTTDLNGLFKMAYADKIENLIPDESILTRSIKFQGRDYLLGNQYNQPVIVRSEQGFTYSRPNNGTFALNPASSMKTQNAIVDGFIILEQSGISYEAVARSDNVNSFRNAVDLVMGDAMESFGRRLEIALLYGQSPTGLGALQSATGVDSTHTTLAFTVGQWSAGLWTPLEGAGLDVYSSAHTALNTAGPVVVSSINVVNKTITVSGATGDITAINAGVVVGAGVATTGTLVGGGNYLPGSYTGVHLTGGSGTGAIATIVVNGATVVSSVVITSAGTGYTVGDALSAHATDLGVASTPYPFNVLVATVTGGSATGGYLRFYTAGTDGADEAVGLDKIMLNTGTLFGIDAGVYSLWMANQYAVGGSLTLAKIQAGVAIAAQRGLSEDVDIYVNPSVWQEMSTEQVAYRMLDSSYSSKKAVNGFEALEFFSQNGKLTVMAHKYVKEGEAFLLPTDRAVRIGSSDVSFNIPGTDNGQIFIQNPTTAGFTFRIFSQQSLLVTKPAVCVKFTGIL